MNRTRARLASLALTVAVVAGAVASVAAAYPTSGAGSSAMAQDPQHDYELVLDPKAASTLAAEPVAYTAVVKKNNDPFEDVTRLTRFSIAPTPGAGSRPGPSDGSCDLVPLANPSAEMRYGMKAAQAQRAHQPAVVAECTTTVAGPHTVTGTVTIEVFDPQTESTVQINLTGTADLQVKPGPLASLTLTPKSATITAGDRQTYHAVAADKFGNPRGDTITFAIAPDGFCGLKPPLPEQPGEAADCTATVAGTYTVTARARDTVRKKGERTTLTAKATLQVEPAPLTKLTLTPESATITAGGNLTYHAVAADKYGNARGDTITFAITPNGDCRDAGPDCTATKAGAHTVTATAPTSDPALNKQGQTTITAEATLQVEPGPLASLDLTPQSATITPGHWVTYKAHGADSFGNSRGDYTGQTAFAITGGGGCPNAGPTCTAAKTGTHTVMGTVDLEHGHVTGTATLQVTPKTTQTPTHAQTPTHTHTPTLTPTQTPTPTQTSSSTAPPQPLTTLVLNPGSAVIKPGESVHYTAIGYGADNNFLGDRTAATRFSISPPGSCAGTTCTAPSAGVYTVTGTVEDGNRTVTGTASLRAAATSRKCVALAGRFHRLRVAPGKGMPGTSLHVTAKLGRKFAHCPVALFLGGTPLGGDLAVKHNGRVSGLRTVPADAKPGRAQVVLAAADGRAVAMTSFDVLQKPTPVAWWRREQAWPLSATAALLLAGAAAASVSGHRARRQRQWVRRHVRVKTRPSPGHLIAERDPRDAPTVTLRLRPRRDAGTTEITKGGG
jgi:hypothetical protein